MTTIRYSELHSNKHIIKISLDGHADYNPGNDPVCAGLSAITYQLLGVVSMLEDNDFISNAEADVEPGHTVITFQVHNYTKWMDAWEIIKIGYQNIAEEYPNNVFME